MMGYIIIGLLVVQFPLVWYFSNPKKFTTRTYYDMRGGKHYEIVKRGGVNDR